MIDVMGFLSRMFIYLFLLNPWIIITKVYNTFQVAAKCPYIQWAGKDLKCVFFRVFFFWRRKLPIQ